MAAELATMEQALERLDANVAVAVPKLSEADAASATSVSGGNRSSMNRCSQRNAARS